MQKKSLSLFFIFSFFLLFNCEEKPLLTQEEKNYLLENPDLVVGVYINYPPYEFINKNGNVDGILLDYFNEVETTINHTFKKEYYSNWQALIQDSKSEKVDIVLEIQNTEGRLEYLTFTKPIFKGNHVIITKKQFLIHSIKDLVDKKVAVGENYAIEEYIKENHPNIILIPKANEAECIKALANNDVEAFIGLESIANYIIKNEGYSDLVIRNKIQYDNELGIAINKNKPLLATIINKANGSISTDKKNEIINKWLYDIVKPFHKKSSFWQALIVIIGSILLLSFLFNYYLKREVNRRTALLKKAKVIAEKHNKLKTLFLQNISHEVRTPLNSIIGFASFLKENTLEETDKKGFVDTILQQSSNLTNILNNVVEISELTITKSEPKKQAFCLEKELNIFAEVYKIRAKRKGLDFKFNNLISKPESIILSDKSRLIKTIDNLLDNAIKFTNQGSVVLSSEIKNNNIILQIVDTGIGIQSEKSKVIFDEFYQIEQELSKKYDGLGIGLTIAKGNIKSLKGTISLDSNTKEGTSFTITLPYHPVPDHIVNETPKLIDSTLKILIVEDMKLNYLVLQKMLDKLILDDKAITWVENGQEAVDSIKDSHFDIIFMDIKMPVLDGYQATKQIKSTHPKIPIIAQTAYADEEDYNKAMAIGFDGYLTKPINSNALKIILQDLFVVNTTSN